MPKATGLGVTLIAGAVPVPLSATVWGLPVALSLTVSAADSAPTSDGVNVNARLVFAPGATLTGRVGAGKAKSDAFAPVMESAEMTSVAVPVLLIVTDRAVLLVPFGWLPKIREFGANAMAGAVPTPERPTEWGLPAALSVMLSDADSGPVVLGVKVTLIVAFAPGAMEIGNVTPEIPKSAELAPVTASEEITSVAVPLLAMVTVAGALLVALS